MVAAASKGLTTVEWAYALRMYEAEAPVGWIAAFFKVSRQAVWEMLAKHGALRDQPPKPKAERNGKAPRQLWPRWRSVILSEMSRQQLEIAELARRGTPDANAPKARRIAVSPRERAIYSALRGEYTPRLDTLQAILDGLGKGWAWLEREAAKLKG